MHTQRVEFDNGRGQTLAARLDRPLREAPLAYALFAHCFTCSKNLNAVVQLSRALVEQGWAVLRFDFTGLGESEGEFSETHFSSNVEDLVAAGRWLEQAHEAPRLLIGHSLGGAAVLRAAGQLDGVTSVATLGAPAEPSHVVRLLTSKREEIEERGEAEVELGGRRFRIKKSFLDDLAEQSMQDAIANLRRALLIMHAPRDQVVGIDNATKIFTAARHPKSFISLDEADHLLSEAADARFAASIIASWAARYLPAAPAEPSEQHNTAWGPFNKFRTELTVGDHVQVCDEPERYGGTNTGPSPYGYLLSALGACTVMTLRLYADRKGWPLDQAVAHLSHAKVHAKDCEASETEGEARIDCIERSIDLRGNLSDEQRARLREIADRCPVHRTLTGEISIVTKPA